MTEIICWADLETGSECDLKSSGTAVYAEHPSTFIQLFSYAFDDGPGYLWDLYQGEPMPKDLKEAIADPEVVFSFHNRWFDSNVIRNKLPIMAQVPISRYRCTMARALSHGLPGSLDKIGEILGIREDVKKHRRGKALVQLFCKPKKQRDGSWKWATPTTHPEEWQAYREYCVQDTLAMREIAKKMPKWNYPYSPFERDLWELDQIVNERGLFIDLDLAQKAMDAITRAQTELAAQTSSMTEKKVETASQRDAMLKYILEVHGITLPNMQKATVERIVEDDTYPAPLRELLQVRLDTCTTSTAKYRKLMNVTCRDNRLRGTIQFAGASRTLRDSGRMFQPQNLPSKNLMPPEETLLGIDALKLDAAELVGFDVMWLGSSALRYTIMAPPSKKLIVADLSNIEGRVLVWLAGEEWKLKAFRDFDAGIGPDLYKAAYAKAFRIHPDEVTKEQRGVGKVMELALGYSGGVGGVLVFTTSFGINLNDLAEKVLASVPSGVLQEAVGFYVWLNEMDVKEAMKKAADDGQPENWEPFYEPKRTFGLSKEVFAALDSLKRLWRRAHPKVVDFWLAAETACKSAVTVPDQRFPFGNGCYAQRKGKWVRMVLPSGHSLPYPGMKMGNGGGLEFKGVDQFSKKWSNIQTHGGKLVENLSQAFARDIFKYGSLAAEDAGYEIILPLHDEIVAEVPDTDEFTAKGLEKIMATNPPWAKDLPLAAKGFEDYRYHKSAD